MLRFFFFRHTFFLCVSVCLATLLPVPRGLSSPVLLLEFIVYYYYVILTFADERTQKIVWPWLANLHRETHFAAGNIKASSLARSRL